MVPYEPTSMLRRAFFNRVHGRNHHWYVLSVTGAGNFMHTYDVGAVSMSLPHIMASFQAGLVMTSWVLLATLLTTTALLLPAGRLGDIVGRKKIYMLGFIISIAGSALSGLAQDLTQLIIFRVIQATGAAMIQTSSFAIVTAVFPEKERGKGLGSSMAVMSIAATSGPAIAGVLLSLVGWRMIFFITVPIGIIGVILAHLILEEKRVSPPREKVAPHFDYLGAVLATVSIGSFLVGLSLGQDRSWSAPETRLLLGAAVAAGITFLLYEAKQSHPLVDTRLLRNRGFALNNTARCIMFFSVSANILLMPFYLQVVLGYSPMQTGMLIAPLSIVMGAASPLAGWLTNHVSTKILSSVGLGLIGLGLMVISRLGLATDYQSVLWPLLLVGLGHGIFQAPNNTSIMDSVPRDKFGISSGVMSLVREIGRSVGTAVASIIVVNTMFAVVGPVSLYSLKREGASLVQGSALAAFSDGIAKAFVVAAVACVLGIICCLSRPSTARDKKNIGP